MLVRVGVPVVVVVPAVVVPVVVVLVPVVLVPGVVLVASHSPSMTRKSRCSTSTSATRARLRIVRSCGPAGEGG